MNSIIAASGLAELLARQSGISLREANDFIQSYFEIIHQALAGGDDVTIKGLGTFRLTGNSTTPIIFEAATDLSQIVNAPFEMFEPVVLRDGEMAETPPQTPPQTVRETPPQPPVILPPVPHIAEEQVQESYQPVEPEQAAGIAYTSEAEIPDLTAAEQEVAEETECGQTVNEQVTPDPETPVSTYIAPAVMPEYDTPEEPERPSHRKRGFFRRGQRWVWALSGLIAGLLIGFAVGYIISNSSLTVSINKGVSSLPVAYPEDEITGNEMVEESEETTQKEPQDTIRTDVTTPADELQKTTSSEESQKTTATAESQKTTAAHASGPKTYDTVTRTVFLTTLARRYYGQMEYWVYIYDANPDLGNPNRIKPGTKVLIPDKSTLPLTGDTEADIAAAKKRSAQIYGRYSK